MTCTILNYIFRLMVLFHQSSQFNSSRIYAKSHGENKEPANKLSINIKRDYQNQGPPKPIQGRPKPIQGPPKPNPGWPKPKPGLPINRMSPWFN
jgi:hypothetical protein